MVHKQPIIKEVWAGAKKSRNFQTYEVKILMEVDPTLTEEELKVRIRHGQTLCRNMCVEQLNLDKPK